MLLAVTSSLSARLCFSRDANDNHHNQPSKIKMLNIPDDIQIGKMIYARRKELSLNQHAIAGMIGIDQSLYSRKENGEVSFSIQEWMLLCVALFKNQQPTE